MDTPLSFPSTEGLSRSQDGSEFIYGGSIGLNRILDRLRSTAYTSARIPWTLYLINVYTLVDNIFQKHLTYPEMLTAFNTECDILSLYLDAYASADPVYRPSIIFYMPTYDAIPIGIRRPPNEATLEFLEVYRKICAQLPQKPTDITKTPYTVRWAVPVGQGSFPHKDLYNWISMHQPKITYRTNQGQIFLLTGCPIDLHIHRLLKHVDLIERYTGLIKRERDFGTKLIPSGQVPFNSYTHRVFGDKVHLAPMITGRKRTALLEIADKNQWTRLTTHQILTEITTHTELTSSEITRIRL